MEPYQHTIGVRLRFHLVSLWAMVRQCFIWRVKPIHVMTSEETLQQLLKTKCSLARIGDGEWRFMRGGGIGFQYPNRDLRQRLLQLARHPSPKCQLCLPDVFRGLERFTPTARFIWRKILFLQRAWLHQTFGGSYHYGDTLASRFYIDTLDVEHAQRLFSLWQQLWKDRDVLIVEGEYSRIGVGSSLFDGAKSVQRILCPPINAWERYEEILTATKTRAKDKLVLLSLGPTATVLAVALAEAGFWAVDCGHLEIEYQWMMMRATEKVPIPNRWVNEAGGCGETAEDEAVRKRYEAQILVTIR